MNIVVLVIFGSFMVLPMIYAISMRSSPWTILCSLRFSSGIPPLTTQDLFLLMAQSGCLFPLHIQYGIHHCSSTAGHVVVASMAAYALEKHKFPGAKLFFSIVVTSLMFSPVVTAIPNYMVMAKLKWLDTYLALIIPAFGYSLGLFLMKQFMVTIPDSLLESARMDGASEFRTFWTVAMPCVKPAWLTLIIFSFQTLWGATGSTFIYSEELKTLPYALNQILLGGFARAGVGAAVILLMMIVPVILFMVTQSSIIQTMSTSGLKE